MVEIILYVIAGFGPVGSEKTHLKHPELMVPGSQKKQQPILSKKKLLDCSE